MIVQKQTEHGWGKSVVETLASDLQKEFPGQRGFSVRNLWQMVALYSEYQSDKIMQSMTAEISFTHNALILSKCKKRPERQFYIAASKKFGWTTRVLEHQIDNKTFEKYLLNQTSFDLPMPDKYKDQKILAIKDHYTFDFLELAEDHSERELELALLKNIRGFLLELGGDFSFIGHQYRLVVEDEEFFIDLLLYHRRLQSLVAIELKTGNFKPEYKGKREGSRRKAQGSREGISSNPWISQYHRVLTNKSLSLSKLRVFPCSSWLRGFPLSSQNVEIRWPMLNFE